MFRVKEVCDAMLPLYVYTTHWGLVHAPLHHCTTALTNLLFSW
jgi:hypothetical protein